MFKGLAPWLERVPGRLLHTNIIGCTIFAAVSGSSAATCATIGKMTLPELKSRGYPEDITVGTLAGAGTLGLLIPPSIIMIVYGVSANVSIAHLFIAGVIPGLLLALLFSGYITAWALLHPDKIPKSATRTTIRQKLSLALLRPGTLKPSPAVASAGPAAGRPAGEGTIPVAEAAKHLNEKVTVEMTVRNVGGTFRSSMVSTVTSGDSSGYAAVRENSILLVACARFEPQ